MGVLVRIEEGRDPRSQLEATPRVGGGGRSMLYLKAKRDHLEGARPPAQGNFEVLRPRGPLDASRGHGPTSRWPPRLKALQARGSTPREERPPGRGGRLALRRSHPLEVAASRGRGPPSEVGAFELASSSRAEGLREEVDFYWTSRVGVKFSGNISLLPRGIFACVA
ncbi:hypothetical protein Salat_1723300 [Sesamum alatum]|uniref:Uncharacterized protein n=1 Tax=Sesamum alatum TaxID=300844 RepID=A0AAE1Y8E2_9LAMI|nr:hypothetical protein Salat_1723300 [Sesamum alatum]